MGNKKRIDVMSDSENKIKDSVSLEMVKEGGELLPSERDGAITKALELLDDVVVRIGDRTEWTCIDGQKPSLKNNNVAKAIYLIKAFYSSADNQKVILQENQLRKFFFLSWLGEKIARLGISDVSAEDISNRFLINTKETLLPKDVLTACHYLELFEHMSISMKISKGSFTLKYMGVDYGLWKFDTKVNYTTTAQLEQDKLKKMQLRNIKEQRILEIVQTRFVDIAEATRIYNKEFKQMENEFELNSFADFVYLPKKHAN